MLVGYIRRSSSDGAAWWVVACARWHCRLGAAWLCSATSSVQHPRAVCHCCGGFLCKSCQRSCSPGELRDCGIGFVGFVFCFVFYHLPVVLLLSILSHVSSECWIQYGTMTVKPQVCQDRLWAYQWRPKCGWRKPVISFLHVFEIPSE